MIRPEMAQTSQPKPYRKLCKGTVVQDTQNFCFAKLTENTKHIINLQISMLLLKPIFAGTTLSLTNGNAITAC